MRSQTQTSLGRRNESVDQIDDLAVVSQNILQVRLLVLRLESLSPFVPHDHRTSTPSNNHRHFSSSNFRLFTITTTDDLNQ